MKLNGFVGKGSGKLGSSIFAISGGEQIVRQHNPQVANPQTPAQTEQRAKFKLMSQIAATMSPVFAFKKQGLVSARNQFVSRNIGLCTYTEDDGAKCNIIELDITGGQLPLPAVAFEFAAAGLDVHLATRAAANIKRVLYAAFTVDDNEKLVFLGSVLATAAGQSGDFPATFEIDAADGYVFAYGIADENASVTQKFEDYLANLNNNEAALAVVSYVRASLGTLSVTKAVKFHGA